MLLFFISALFLNPAHATNAVDDSATKQVIQFTNQFRAQNGLSALKSHELLAEAAQTHAQDMATRNYFAHTSKNGDTPGDRISSEGYPWKAYAENIARGQTTARQVVTSWINSPGHRANLLSRKVSEIGVGVFKNSKGSIYWVQNFGARQ